MIKNIQSLFDNPLTLPTIVLLCTSIAWGVNWWPLKTLNTLGLEGLILIFVSHAVLFIVLVPFGIGRFQFRQYWKPLIGISLAGGTAIVCFTYALMYGDIIRVMVLFYLLPVWGVLGGKIFLGEAIGVHRACGVVIALIGAFLILDGFQVLEKPPSWIDFFAFLSGLTFAINNLLFRGVERVPLIPKAMMMFTGCVFISGSLLAVGVQEVPLNIEASTWGWLLLYTLTWLIFANIGSQWAIVRMEAGRSSIIIITELVAAVISAMLIAGERLTSLEGIGCMLVITAAVLETMRPGQAKD